MYLSIYLSIYPSIYIYTYIKQTIIETHFKYHICQTKCNLEKTKLIKRFKLTNLYNKTRHSI